MGKHYIQPANAGTAATENVVRVQTVNAAGVVVDPSGGGGAGGATEAKQDTQITSLEAIRVAVQILDNIVAGSEAQVDVLTLPALAAGTNFIGTIAAAERTDAIYSGPTSLVPDRAIIDAASSGDNTLLAAQGASNAIRVLSLWVIASAAVTIRFESAAGGTALSGQMVLPAGGGFTLPHNPYGWFQTADNALLNLELSGAISVDGGFTYVVV